MERILIVDDATFMREMLGKILSNEGYEICGEAGNAREAVARYKELKPDLVTMDIVMPMMEELDGIGAVKEIIKLDPSAKILIVSAMTHHALGVEAIRAGAKEFINKPFKPVKVVDAVRIILRERKNEQ